MCAELPGARRATRLHCTVCGAICLFCFCRHAYGIVSKEAWTGDAKTMLDFVIHFCIMNFPCIFAVPASNYMYSFHAILEVERGTLLSFSLLKRHSSSDSGHLARTRQREREQHGAFNPSKILSPASTLQHILFFYMSGSKRFPTF